MKVTDAKRIVTDYIKGRGVAPDQFGDACATLSRDEDLVTLLRQQFWIAPSEPSDCEAFRERLAEFGEMKADERRRLVPGLVDHFSGCSSCRKAYWQVFPAWTENQSAALIRVVRSFSGALRETLVSPPALAVIRGEATLSNVAPQDRHDGEIQLMREWLLPLDNADLELRVRLTSSDKTVTTRIQFYLERRNRRAFEDETAATIEIMKAADVQPETLYLGSISRFDQMTMMTESHTTYVVRIHHSGYTRELNIAVDEAGVQ